MSQLNKEQQEAVDTVLGHHSLLLLGQAGTGKSHVLRTLYTELTSRLGRQSVAIVTTTGRAATQFPGATTLHRWAGLEDCRYGVHQLCSLVNTDQKFEAAKHRIQQCQVLMVDEVSMLSMRTFDLLHHLCCSIRGRRG